MNEAHMNLRNVKCASNRTLLYAETLELFITKVVMRVAYVFFHLAAGRNYSRVK